MNPTEPSQLDRIEGRVNLLWSRVDNLDRRAGIWGAITSAILFFATKLTGCM